MNRLRWIALSASLLLHGAVLALFLAPGWKPAARGPMILPPERFMLRLVDPSLLPGEEPEVVEARPSLSKAPSLDAGSHESGNLPETAENGVGAGETAVAGTGQEMSADGGGWSEELPPGGKYPGPPYPERARKENREGFVTVLMEVDGSGRISSIRIDRSEGGSDFARSVLKTAGLWQFPEGVPGRYRRTFIFRLGGS